MSRGQRLGLIALAVVVAVVAFVIARPEDDDDKGTTPSAATAPRGRAGTDSGPTATTEPRPEQRIVLRDNAPEGGARRIVAEKGEFVRVTVESDSADEIHVHGYDITREARPGEPARFSFRAEIEGIFEIESHEAEHRGGDAVIARLVVEP